MKEKRTTIFRTAVFVLITILLLLGLSEGMKSTDMTAVTNMKGFYLQKKNSLDVVVIGASDVYTAYSPTLAWEEYGYTSYNLATPGASGNMYKFLLAEVLRTQQPKVVAFEINGFVHKDEYFYREGQIRNIIDNMPWGRNRLQAIREIVPEESRMSYYFPLQVYHDRWADPVMSLGNLGVKAGYSVLRDNHMKGFSTYSFTMPFEERAQKGKYHLTEQGRACLKDLMEYCREQGVEHVLFFQTPHARVKGGRDALEALWAEVASYGYDTMDFDADPDALGIDLAADFYNAEHLNIFGMEKFTGSFGAYLIQMYGLPASHPAAVCAAWDESAEKTDMVLEKCRADMEAGVIRRHMEPSVYFQPMEASAEEIEELTMG